MTWSRHTQQTVRSKGKGGIEVRLCRLIPYIQSPPTVEIVRAVSKFAFAEIASAVSSTPSQIKS
jgi:hypothetical protein